jgi:hypothetical protein
VSDQGRTYHSQMHRVYRTVKKRIAMEIGRDTPLFADHVRREFRRQVERLELVQPRFAVDELEAP